MFISPNPPIFCFCGSSLQPPLLLRPRSDRKVAPVEDQNTEKMAGLLVLLLVFLCFLNMYLVFKIWNLEDRITVPSLSLVERAYRPPLQRYEHFEEGWLNHFASQSIPSSGGNSWMEVLREQEVQHHRDLQARSFPLNHAFFSFCQIGLKSHFITRTGNQLLMLHPSCFSKQRTQ